ncbi:endonuclease/exonuclease/phosphatase family protein [Phycicoccus sp.]|uniref:endonuclease/exonuclease/phosphatase family protein n=1 Tax=Phycicoccus sp. TaxID=1902410 RepID=UPI002C402533|nr:endonuclease/exonuclease/phosphatase family protein [Phycicoccus sp.]HMM93453.1 endonuclease/exonuclease/phosphatase family protein [Phycicoccus sp.]
MDSGAVARRRRWRPVAVTLGLTGLVGTLVLTGARVLEPRSYPMALLATVSPAAVVSGLFTAALLAMASLVRGRGRLPAAASALLALALVAVHVGWLAPSFVGATPPAGPGRGLTVLSQNFEYGDVADLVATTRAVRADIVVLVDVQPDQFDRLLASGFLSAYPYRSGVDSTSPSNTIVLSRFRYTEQRTIAAGHDSRLYRLEGTPVGTLAFAAVHPPPPYVDGSQPWRDQLRTIGDALGAQLRSEPSVPVLAAGDFNADVEHQPFRRLLGVGALRDAAELANTGWAPTFPANDHWTSHGVAPPAFTAIDHVLLGPTLTVTGVRRTDISGSDHLGLVVHVALRAGAPTG